MAKGEYREKLDSGGELVVRDYTIEISGDLYDTKEDIVNIARDIVNKFDKNGREENKKD